MPPEIAAGRVPSSSIRYALESSAPATRPLFGPAVADRLSSLGASVRPGWRLAAGALLGCAAALAVGYVTALNPHAAPGDLAVVFRVVIIGIPIGAGLFAQTRDGQARMGRLLVVVGLCSSLWLLNGSRDRLLFTIGLVAAGLAPTLFAYLVLAHPTGYVRCASERRFIWWTGGALALLWLALIAVSTQPPAAPLLQCVSHCPQSMLSVGSAPGLAEVARVPLVGAWLTVTCGTAALLWRRIARAAAPLRRALLPACWAAVVGAILLIAYLILLASASGAARTVGTLYVAVGAVIPLAILAGLSGVRMYMGRALAEFVNQLSRSRDADPETLMARALGDPSLRIAYPRAQGRSYVDSSGREIHAIPAEATLAWIRRDRREVAAVLYNAALADQERFVQAAGAAALLRLEKTQLEADLKASVADLTASRARTMEMAAAERRRVERDLHDGVQQQLVGLRIKLEIATETVMEDPTGGRRALASVGRQIDDVLRSVRSLARGIYPPLLHERGLADAVKSAALDLPAPVVVRTIGIGRYAEEVEVAVYFSCVEALQNVLKHAGSNASCTTTLRQDGTRLCFEVRDFGIGFEPDTVTGGSGLENMRDRVEAIGGTLTITSSRGHGTSVWGSVPVC